MQRREFLAGAAITSAVGLAGCAGLTEPQMEFQQYINPDPNVVTVDVDDNDAEHFVTIQNQGESGNIRLELWYLKDIDTPRPRAPSIYLEDARSDQYFDLARTFFYDAGERRQESIFASSDAPSVENFPEFLIAPWAASYGAIFENAGATGEVEFSFNYRDTAGYELTEPSNQMTTVSSDSTVEIMFETVVPPEAEYEVVAEPV